MPSLEKLHKKFKDDQFTFLAVNVGEIRETVRKFINDNGYSFLNVLDESKQVSTQYRVRSHPMKFLINKNGDLIGIAKGYREWNTDEMIVLIRTLMHS